MQEWLARAAGELALDVEIGHCETLADGTILVAVAWFPHLGSVRGILIFDWTSNIDPESRKYLVAQGFALSTFGEPAPREEFDLENYRAMFADWGWAGPEHLRPEWMK